MNLSSNQIAKQNEAQQLHGSFAEKEIAVVFHYHGLTVAAFSELRRLIRESNAKIAVVKNTLARIAVKDTQFECLEEILVGPNAVAYSNDPSFAKKIVEFAKTNENLKVIGGALNGKLMDKNSVQVLATLPSLDELRAQIVGVISAPARNIVCAINAVPGGIARVIQAHADNNG